MNILAMGAHPDDIEIGCFGTLSKYKKNGHNLFFLMLTDGGDGGDAKFRRHEQEVNAKLIGAEVKFGGFPSAYLNNDSGRATIEEIEKAITAVKPDVIFSHSNNDSHQDHRLVNQATVSACRFFHGELYFYEGYSSLKTFQPRKIIEIGEFFQDKLKVISLYHTQKEKFYMKPELITAVAIFRAAQFGFLGRAEAFEIGGIVG